jgi:hypothetical protein
MQAQEDADLLARQQRPASARPAAPAARAAVPQRRSPAAPRRARVEAATPELPPVMDEDDYSTLVQLQNVVVPLSDGVLGALPVTPFVPGRTAVEPCPVCLEKYEAGDEIMRLPCLHPFHGACIREWFKSSKKCPVCNEEVRV